MKERHQQELIGWMEAVIKELDKHSENEKTKLLQEGGTALLREIKTQNTKDRLLMPAFVNILGEKQQQKVVKWIETAIKELDKYRDNKNIKLIKGEGKALLEEIRDKKT